MNGEPAGLISRTEEEMEWIVEHITPFISEMPGLGWQRNSIYLRFGHKDYQKGSTLTEIARLYEIPTSHVLAMGDSHNDIEMLSETHSGLAACPANAVGAIRELVIARSGFVASTTAGNGVVEALRKILPENL
jgi:hydroxymethylpyrimidine pyrophosphatase-like HAD family hydrolase